MAKTTAEMATEITVAAISNAGPSSAFGNPDKIVDIFRKTYDAVKEKEPEKTFPGGGLD